MSDPLKFLVVDPLAGVQTFARQLLQSHGFAADSILCCADTDVALAQGLIFKPQFLITDWFAKAPLTGIQLYQRLRDARASLQLALLSFDVTPAHEFEAQVLGAHFLLKKPFTAEQLKAEMARALEAWTKPSPIWRTTPRPGVSCSRFSPSFSKSACMTSTWCSVCFKYFFHSLRRCSLETHASASL